MIRMMHVENLANKEPEPINFITRKSQQTTAVRRVAVWSPEHFSETYHFRRNAFETKRDPLDGVIHNIKLTQSGAKIQPYHTSGNTATSRPHQANNLGYYYTQIGTTPINWISSIWTSAFKGRESAGDLLLIGHGTARWIDGSNNHPWHNYHH